MLAAERPQAPTRRHPVWSEYWGGGISQQDGNSRHCEVRMILHSAG
jgi:hypothetical protein